MIDIKNMATAELLNYGAQIKTDLGRLDAENKAINKELLARAVFPEGKGTATLTNGLVKVKVSRRYNEKWDNDALENARGLIGTDKFLTAFQYSWQPKSKSAVNFLLGMVSAEEADALNKALSKSEGSPSVTYEFLGD